MINQIDTLNDCGWYVEDNILLDSEINHLKKGLSKNLGNTALGKQDFGTNNLELLDVIITNPLFKGIINRHISDPIIIRSIYFDKPPKLNWLVGWRQGLTVNLKRTV